MRGRAGKWRRKGVEHLMSRGVAGEKGGGLGEGGRIDLDILGDEATILSNTIDKCNYRV